MINITITQSAQARIQDVLAEETSADPKLRVFVEGGGCAGLRYGFVVEESSEEDDWIIDIPGYQLLIDPLSAQYLEGSSIDFKKSLAGEGFVISNPNAGSSCGCGSSFSV